MIKNKRINGITPKERYNNGKKVIRTYNNGVIVWDITEVKFLGIYFVKKPKTSYQINEIFNGSMVVYARYSDGTTKDVTKFCTIVNAPETVTTDLQLVIQYENGEEKATLFHSISVVRYYLDLSLYFVDGISTIVRPATWYTSDENLGSVYYWNYDSDKTDYSLVWSNNTIVYYYTQSKNYYKLHIERYGTNNITKIDNCPIANKLAIKILRIPDWCTEIGESAFSNCTNLSMIYIPKSVVKINANAFVGCNVVRAYVPCECEVDSTAFDNFSKVTRYENESETD